MVKVSPSILSGDFADLRTDVLSMARSGADYVHVDVMDGLFVPNITIGIPVVSALSRVSPLPLDVHLMIVRPGRYVEEFCRAGAGILTVHLESDTPENIRAALIRIRELGVRPGLSLSPGTPAKAALPYLELCSLLLVMTVEPGFGGQKFMADMLPKARLLHSWLQDRNPACELEVDGGVSEATFAPCVDSGANVLVAGSAYFKAQDRAAFVGKLKA